MNTGAAAGNPREVRVIGIGTGSPAHVTGQAIAALRECDVFLVADKGEVKDELVAVRRAICEEFLDDGAYRIVTVTDPERGPDAERDRAAYRTGVDAWHAARADRYAEIIQGLPAGETVGPVMTPVTEPPGIIWMSRTDFVVAAPTLISVAVACEVALNDQVVA